MNNQIEHIELRSEEVQEILGHIPASIIRYGIVVILSVLVVLLIGSFYFSYPDILIAPVEVTSYNAPAAIVAKNSGNLTSIFVTDSLYVKEHQALAVVKNPASFEHVQWLQTELQLQKHTENGKIDTMWFSILPDTLQLGDLQSGYASLLKAGQDYLRFKQLNFLGKKIEALQQKQVELQKFIGISSKQVVLKQKEILLSGNQFLRDSQLFSKQVISLADYEKARKELLQQSMMLESLRSSEVNARMQMQDLVQQIAEYQLENIDQEQQFKNQWMQSFQNLENLINGWFDGYVLVAPMEGIVAFNKIWSRNQFVTAGSEVFTILPLHQSQIIGRITLPAKGSGKVCAGQTVNLKFESFPYQEFGMVTAVVSAVSLVPAEQNYTVEINLPDTLITNYGFILPFSQKMQGLAEIITEEMPLIMRLFNPLKSLFKNHWTGKLILKKQIKAPDTSEMEVLYARQKIVKSANESSYQEVADTIVYDIKSNNNSKNKEVPYFHIIAGSFLDSSKATTEMESYGKKGYKTQLIPSNQLYRVSIYSNSNKEKAFEILEQIQRSENNPAIWVLKIH